MSEKKFLMSELSSRSACDNRQENLTTLLRDLNALYEHVSQGSAQRLAPFRARFPHGFSVDACNLADYLALRNRDLRPLQARLEAAGLSSLGRCESHVRANLARVMDLLRRALGEPPLAVDTLANDGHRRLEERTDALFQARNAARYSRIMVTLPTAAASEPALLAALLKQGMDCARINCAHDDPATWENMLRNLQQAQTETGRRCSVLMDLAGHKLRTGPIACAEPVLHLHPQRNAFGQVITPARVRLVHPGQVNLPSATMPPRLPVSPALLERLQPGDSLALKDTRGKKRRLHICAGNEREGWLAECVQSTYIVPGTPLSLEGDIARSRGESSFVVSPFDGAPLVIRLCPGERFLLRNDLQPGRPRQQNAAGEETMAEISCSLPSMVDLLQPGHGVWIDDGKLGCEVEALLEHGALLRVTHAGPRGVKVRSDKGINLPNTSLPLPALTEKDLTDLDFVCRHADMVGMSFVRGLDDVDTLRAELAQRQATHLPIVIKIETAAAVKNLPAILLGTLDQHPFGIMIARGDLAVELGSVRMAEIQEEILWLCEAAHVPVVWATQVLETLAQKGTISRPEITDAAVSVRAECVMMNKGPFIVYAVQVLNDILSRMDAHQYKKVSRLRKLHW